MDKRKAEELLYAIKRLKLLIGVAKTVGIVCMGIVQLFALINL